MLGVVFITKISIKHTKKCPGDDGTRVKPEFFTKTEMRCSSDYDPVQKMWDRDQRMAIDNFGIKIKSTGYIYLPVSKYHDAEGHLTMSSCLQYAVIDFAPMIIKYINKMELYTQCPPRRVRDKKITEIENTLCPRTVMKVNTVIRI